MALLRVYLDVETYRPKKSAFTGEDIILIGLLHDGEAKPKLFKNFKRKRERSMLIKFYRHLGELMCKDDQKESKCKKRQIEIVGFNILRYDVPLLIAKSLKRNVVGEIRKIFGLNDAHGAEVLSKFWHNIYVVDIQQVLLPLNRMVFKSLTLKNAIERLKELGICEQLQSIKACSGEDIKKWYESNDYNKIVNKNKMDLIAIQGVYTCIRSISHKFCKIMSQNTVFYHKL